VKGKANMSSIKINGSGAGQALRISGGSGSAIRIAPPVVSFSPSSLPGLKAWYSASTLTGLFPGDTINTWADGSEFGNTLTREGGQVSYVAADSLLNNRPSAAFGGGFMDLNFSAGNTIPSGDSFTLYTVGYSAGTNGTYACMGGPGAWQQMLGFVPYNGTTYCNLNGNNAATKAISVNTPVILSYGYQTGTGAGNNLFYVNGSNSGITQTDDSETINLNQGFRIGARYASDILPLVGHVAEVLLYLGKQDDTSRGLVTSYLADKYGISI
jgi:hypothetical protein